MEISCNNKGFFGIEEIYESYISCKKHKKSDSAFKFNFDLENNLFNLLNSLNTDNYKISRAICFVVTKPKIREIWASDFKDRIVHHLVIKYLNNFYENPTFQYYFLENVFSNRIGKGTHKAVTLVKRLSKKYKYYLKLDIYSFFNSIDRDLLFSIITSDLKNVDFEKKELILKLIKQIIFHKYTTDYVLRQDKVLINKVPKHKSLFTSEINNKGLPIGNFTSQFFANVYLNRLDYFVVKKLKFDDYVRYVDDFVIFSNNKDELNNLIQKIDNFLKSNLDLKLNRDKVFLSKTMEGLDFLGYFIKPDYTLVRKRVVSEFKRKLFYFTRKDITYYELKKVNSIVNSYFGHFKYANSYNLKRKMSKKLSDYFNLKNVKGNTIVKKKVDLNFKNFYEQYSYFKNKYKYYLVVFQMGNFYRFFNEQAFFVSDKLNLKILLKRYSKNKYFTCGFPLNSKKLNLIKDLNLKYIIVKQIDNTLPSGLIERVVKEISSEGDDFKFDKKYLLNGGSLNESDSLFSILNWDLESMTPMEVFKKVYNIINYYNKNGNEKKE